MPGFSGRIHGAATVSAMLGLAVILPAAAHAAAPTRIQTLLDSPRAWPAATVAAIGRVQAEANALESAGNILAVYCDPADELTVRVSLVAPVGIHNGVNHFANGRIRTIVLIDEGPGGNGQLPLPLRGVAPFAWDRMLVLDPAESMAHVITTRIPEGALPTDGGAVVQVLAADRYRFHIEDGGWMAASLPRAAELPTQIAVFTLSNDQELDRLVAPIGTKAAAVYEANVAFMHFGNQGLAYSDVFKGRSGAEGSSGFDEVLRVHEQKNVPGNFHLSGLLQSSAEWNARNGDPVDFNAWLRAGAAAGWAGIVSSPYGQAIMPFIQNAMNDWAIDRQVSMETFRYNYVPRVAWVPERCWMTPGQFPDNGVISYTGANWQAHGINGVILDDSPHANGHDNHQIHTVSGNGLRLIPRDGYFTGRMHVGDGAAALAVLTGLAGSGNGTFRLVTYADDWEMAAEMGNWATDFPFALDTYLWMIDKCATESAWLHTWKLDPALTNPNFNGDTFTPVNGTYGGIGDVNGYGGNNNAWYGDWAGYVPYANGGNGNGACANAGGNCKNHGTIWNDAHFALQNAPNNSIRETGWYVMMTNLHETAWHDYLGGPLSGWQRQYSAHIKNANIYAEAAKWAGGQYASATGAFFSDIDNDGYNELVMHNDRVFAVFESNGGRCTHLFAKGAGYNYSVIGIDNAYWAGTEGDYNDVNHVGGLSDVGPNYQHDLYGMAVDIAAGNSVQATLTHSGVKKVVRLTLGQPYLDCVYRVGANTQYIQSGWSPDVVDLLYNAEMDRVWGGGNQTYMGQRNPNTGATGAYVLGSGGATHNIDFQSTLMKADEISGTQKFQFYIYAGATSVPNGSGQIAELEALKTQLTDQLAPEALSGTYFPATRQLALTFDEAVRYNEVILTAIAIDANNNGSAEVTLDGACTVLNTGNAATITIQVSTAVHNAIQALIDKSQMRLLLVAGAVKDGAGNGHVTLTHTGNVPVSYGPPTLITLDGRFDPAEWPACAIAVADSLDSQWNAAPNNITNEIQAVYATWDSTYLYLGVRGIVTGNSWLLYLDTDPGGPNGQVDLRTTNAWERGVQFTAPGFRADWQLGAYQHQGPFDSQSFFKITGAATTQDSSAVILKAFDPAHAYGLNGGTELAVPWSVLYGAGGGRVTANAQLGLVATLCYDPEPGGEAGGDQAPSNTAGVLAPTLNNRVLIPLDQNGDGYPDPIDRRAPALAAAAATSWDSVITLTFDEPVTAASANSPSRYTVFETANPGATLDVESATLQPDQVHVVLRVSPMSYVGYTVVANGIRDQSCFSNVVSQTSATFQGPPVAVETTLPGSFELASPFPNPARGRTRFDYALPQGSDRVTLDVYDLHGRRLRRLFDGEQSAGRHRIEFDGRNDRGEALAPGMFFVRLSRGAEQRVKRLIVMP